MCWCGSKKYFPLPIRQPWICVQLVKKSQQLESVGFLVRFDHLLMCSATIPLLTSFDRGGNRDLKRLSNLTKVISSKWQSLDLKRSRLALASVCLTTCSHSLSCPRTTWLLLKNKNKMMQNNRNQPKEKKGSYCSLLGYEQVWFQHFTYYYWFWSTVTHISLFLFISIPHLSFYLLYELKLSDSL